MAVSPHLSEVTLGCGNRLGAVVLDSAELARPGATTKAASTRETDDILGDFDQFAKALATLSGTQFAVLTLLARGYLNKQIADRCGTSDATVKSHISEILKKLGVRTRTLAAVRYAVYLERQNGSGIAP